MLKVGAYRVELAVAGQIRPACGVGDIERLRPDRLDKGDALDVSVRLGRLLVFALVIEAPKTSMRAQPLMRLGDGVNGVELVQHGDQLKAAQAATRSLEAVKESGSMDDQSVVAAEAERAVRLLLAVAERRIGNVQHPCLEAFEVSG
jgi:hypothetical protein